MKHKSFGTVLKEIRRRDGLTQVQLAKVLGITPGNVSRYESSGIEPTAETIRSMSKKSGLSSDYLLGLKP